VKAVLEEKYPIWGIQGSEAEWNLEEVELKKTRLFAFSYSG